MPPHRMRRVIVKVYIARASQGLGRAAFRAHLDYIQRDGVDRGEDSRGDRPDPEINRLDSDRDPATPDVGEDGRTGAGRLYSHSDAPPDGRAFLARSAEDRHQFRIIVSPEDGDQLGDLSGTTRRLMAQAERDLGTSLDWVAVDHHNTGHPHTHIVIRCQDDRGRDLVIAQDYLTRGLRHRAQAIVLDRLGPRRDMEIAQAQAQTVRQRRWTRLDRELASLAQDDVLVIRPATGARDRFNRTLHVRRLTMLEQMGLATAEGPLRWRLSQNWQAHLEAEGRRGDIIRSLSAATGRALKARDVAIFGTGEKAQAAIVGQVIQNSPLDELRDRRTLAVEGLHGTVWHVPLGAQPAGTIPPPGAIVELSRKSVTPKQSDRTIAAIAQDHGGRYSVEWHRQSDPSASPAFLTAHKRRLEALRRAGWVSRDKDGVWSVGTDYLTRAAQFVAQQAGAATLTVKSWVDLETQITAKALVWLDEADSPDGLVKGFGAEVRAARAQRMRFLRREGLWFETQGGIDPAKKRTLARQLLRQAAASEAARSGRQSVEWGRDGRFEGIYEKPIRLATGRFALIGRAKEFTLVPWRPELECHRGVSLRLKRSGKGVSWTLGRSKGLSR